MQKPNCVVPNNKTLAIKININNSTVQNSGRHNIYIYWALKRYYLHNSTINITEN